MPSTLFCNYYELILCVFSFLCGLFVFVGRCGQTTTADMRVQRLVESGVLVLKVDNRGSSRRGLAFESAIQGSMGDLEVLDQQAAVRHFSSRGLVDPHRVGIFGWSYGVSSARFGCGCGCYFSF
jgi:dienelactone hydrolase